MREKSERQSKSEEVMREREGQRELRELEKNLWVTELRELRELERNLRDFFNITDLFLYMYRT